MAERFMGKIIKVCAQIKEFYPSECNIEDTAVVIFEFANGSLGVFTSYWGAGFVDDGEQIIGTKGAIIVNGVENQCPRTSPLGIYTKEDKSWQFPEVEWNWSKSFINLIEHFVTCLQEDKKSIITPEDGRSAIAVVEAIYRSAKEKKIVRVG
jgi:predicted dehydrogenase